MKSPRFTTDFEMSRHISPGLQFAQHCEVCGKLRNAKDHNRARCSRIKQKRLGHLVKKI